MYTVNTIYCIHYEMYTANTIYCIHLINILYLVNIVYLILYLLNTQCRLNPDTYCSRQNKKWEKVGALLIGWRRQMPLL